MIRITEENFHDMQEANGGYCTACKAEAYGVEPDARRYKCEDCGEEQVYGISELLLMGEIELCDKEEDEE